MKSRLIKVLIALVVALAAAGGSYWQLNFNKDWREQYAYAKGVDALIYAFPYFLNTVLRYKWSQPEAPEGQQVPVDAVNKFWHATFVDPKNYRDGGAPECRYVVLTGLVIRQRATDHYYGSGDSG